MNKGKAWDIAFGGVFAGFAIVIMGVGTMIPIATFVCPLICCLMGCLVMRLCGARIAFAWYVAVALLSAILSPDREAVLIYIAFGYYPLLMRLFDRLRWASLLKLLYFNCTIVAIYSLVLRILGLGELRNEYAQLSSVWLMIMLFAGNLTFALMDLLMKQILVKR